MTGSMTGIWILCVVIVVGLAVWLIMVRHAANHPEQKHRRKEHMRGLVQGGQHVGGGRSVAPTRDAPVPEGGGAPSPQAPDVEDMENEQAGRTPGHTRGSGSPLDL